MAQPASPITPVLDYSTTIIGALELSERKWVLAVRFPATIGTQDIPGSELQRSFRPDRAAKGPLCRRRA